MSSREYVVVMARTWLGTKWRHQAMRKNVGVDCIGLIGGVGMECGLLDATYEKRKPEYRAYSLEPMPEILRAACSEYLEEIPISQATLGDVLVFKVIGGLQPQHFGIISKLNEKNRPHYIIHSTNIYPRKVVETRIDEAWRSRIVAAFKYRGL